MIIVFLLLGALAAVCPAPVVDTPTILRYENNNNGPDGYDFAYETSDGISRQEKREGNVVRGFYSYTGPDGILYIVNYIADENGFQPSGNHIPVIQAKPYFPLKPVDDTTTYRPHPELIYTTISQTFYPSLTTRRPPPSTRPPLPPPSPPSPSSPPSQPPSKISHLLKILNKGMKMAMNSILNNEKISRITLGGTFDDLD